MRVSYCLVIDRPGDTDSRSAPERDIYIYIYPLAGAGLSECADT